MLDLKSQMLFREGCFYLNGEAATFSGEPAKILEILADKRKLEIADITTAKVLDEKLLLQLHDWYIAGYLHFTS